MSHIKKFKEFALYEADAMMPDPAAAPLDPAAPVDPTAAPAAAPVTKMPHPSDILVAGKKFFRELTTQVQYWFKYGRMSRTMTLDSVKSSDTGLKIWAKEGEKYSIRAEITLVNPTASIQKVEDVLLSIYYFTPDQNLLKQSEVQVKVADLSEKRFRNEVTKVKDAIVKKPKDTTDVRKFSRESPGELGDDIY